MMTNIVQLLKKNSFFKFLSSVRLAVPLMLVMAIVVSIGTVLESQYNTEYAQIVIYHAWWFSLLQALLWINIFFATISRWPFQKHHIGFVVTHIGLLTLLIGGFVTARWGIDGQMQVPEGEKSGTVVLSPLVVGYQFENSQSSQSVGFERGLKTADFTKDSAINKDFNHLFWIKKYIPFSNTERVVVKDPSLQGQNVAVSFRLRSQFFDVSEWLHSTENPEMKMGPATLKIRRGTPDLQASKVSKKPAAKLTAKVAALVVWDQNRKNILGKKDLAQLKSGSWKVGDLEITVKKVLSRATVSQNRLEEGTSPNPALELEIRKGQKSYREILFAKFPDFSMLQEPDLAAHFTYISDLTEPEKAQASSSNGELPANHPPMGGGAFSSPGGGNEIEFWISPEDQKLEATVILKKAGALVERKVLTEGESFQTPWMGIRVTLASVVHDGRMTNQVREIAPQKGAGLPPAAILVGLSDSSDEFWLTEDSDQVVEIGGKTAQIFFGRKTFQLPFELLLHQFKKEDYPGTSTPMGFSSQVEKIPGGDQHRISMNEPLKVDGFTIYQSSYSMNPGQRSLSIFSVNQDPGRWIKYLGSIILAFGIIIYTIMRSRWWKARTERTLK